MTQDRIVIYLVRRDLRIADNHILHLMSRYDISEQRIHTHLLPVYILPPDQVETSGFLKDGARSPYPPALAENSRVWKCGPHRAKFLAESVWDMKEQLEELKSGLVIRVGRFREILQGILLHYSKSKHDTPVSSVWMAQGISEDEAKEEQEVLATCYNLGVNHVLFHDRKPLVHLHDAPMQSMLDVPHLLHEFLAVMDPVIDQTRDSIEAPTSLPPLPDHLPLPPQPDPYEIPDTLPELVRRLVVPVSLNFGFFGGVNFFGAALDAAPVGGERNAVQRLHYVVREGIASRFHTISDLEESDDCLKLSAYLSLGCITARQVHEALLNLENGYEREYEHTQGFGGGENPGTRAVRHELLRRDFLMLCCKKYRHSLFDLEGSGPGRNPGIEWKSPNPARANPRQRPCPLHIEGALTQFQVGATGYGLIDAIMRQLLCTGYVGYRSQMLIANFLAQFAGIDWRLGAEWVASMALDHDTCLQWYTWQENVGLAADPRRGHTVISPVHEAYEVDPNGSFVRKWMPELWRLTRLSNLFQVATTSPELLLRLGLLGNVMVTNPVPSNTLDLGPTSRINSLHKFFVP
ncbi:DNA photolyase, FAD-binding/Cryptochrome [Trichoderma chlorosporum]